VRCVWTHFARRRQLWTGREGGCGWGGYRGEGGVWVWWGGSGGGRVGESQNKRDAFENKAYKVVNLNRRSEAKRAGRGSEAEADEPVVICLNHQTNLLPKPQRRGREDPVQYHLASVAVDRLTGGYGGGKGNTACKSVRLNSHPIS